MTNDNNNKNDVDPKRRQFLRGLSLLAAPREAADLLTFAAETLPVSQTALPPQIGAIQSVLAYGEKTVFFFQPASNILSAEKDGTPTLEGAPAPRIIRGPFSKPKQVHNFLSDLQNLCLAANKLTFMQTTQEQVRQEKGRSDYDIVHDMGGLIDRSEHGRALFEKVFHAENTPLHIRPKMEPHEHATARYASMFVPEDFDSLEEMMETYQEAGKHALAILKHDNAEELVPDHIKNVLADLWSDHVTAKMFNEAAEQLEILAGKANKIDNSATLKDIIDMLNSPAAESTLSQHSDDVPNCDTEKPALLDSVHQHENAGFDHACAPVSLFTPEPNGIGAALYEEPIKPQHQVEKS